MTPGSRARTALAIILHRHAHALARALVAAAAAAGRRVATDLAAGAASQFQALKLLIIPVHCPVIIDLGRMNGWSRQRTI